MNHFKKYLVLCSLVISVSITIIACSKGGDSTTTPTTPTTPPVVDVCAGKTLTLSAAVANAANVCATGSITITAGGSTGFTYNIDNGTFQTSNLFAGLSVGDHAVIIKDAAGCTKSATVTVAATAGTAGPLFTAVKTVITSICLTCHSGAAANGGKNFANDCEIISSADRIKERTNDGSPSFMPQGGQLSTADKKKITDWVTAGGKFSD